MVDIEKLMILVDDYAFSIFGDDSGEQKRKLIIDYLEKLNDPKLDFYTYYDQNGNRTSDKTKAKTALFLIK